MITLPGAKAARIMLTARPAFLVLTPCCLSLAIASAVVADVAVSLLSVVMILLGALAAHVSVNMFNEYRDFQSGLDFNTQRTPFSGGSGVLPFTPELAEAVNWAAHISGLVTIGICSYFIGVRGWGLLPMGLPGILLVYFYTQKITHWPWLCLIAPGLAFGPLMICGAYYALSGGYSLSVFVGSLVVFFLVNNLLLLNQFPDLEADKQVGRLHLPIMLGRKKSAWVFVIFLVAAYSVLLLSIVAGLLPIYSLLGVLTLFLALPTARRVVLYADDMAQLRAAMAWNVATCLITPVLMSVGMVLSFI